jgi:hypothetical protein
VAHHPAQRAEGEDYVGVDDQYRVVPALGADLAQPVVERVRLALAALCAAQVEHAARMFGGLREHDVGRLVRAGVVDDVDAQSVLRVVEPHQGVDGPSDHERLVPRRDQHRDVRLVLEHAVRAPPEAVQP